MRERCTLYVVLSNVLVGHNGKSCDWTKVKVCKFRFPRLFLLLDGVCMNMEANPLLFCAFWDGFVVGFHKMETHQLNMAQTHQNSHKKLCFASTVGCISLKYLSLLCFCTHGQHTLWELCLVRKIIWWAEIFSLSQCTSGWCAYRYLKSGLANGKVTWHIVTVLIMKNFLIKKCFQRVNVMFNK